MKINKKIFSGMAVLTLLFGLVLVGCSSTQYAQVETEISREIYAEASDLLIAHGGKIKAGDLVSELGKKFPGLKPQAMLAFQYGKVFVDYQGKKYKIEYTREENKTELTSGVTAENKDDQNTIVTGIVSAGEWKAVEP
jgi:hypothetical protein